jgi:hypothetical protein
MQSMRRQGFHSSLYAVRTPSSDVAAYSATAEK